MRSVDKKLIRPLVARFNIEGESYDVFKPSIQQNITRIVEFQEVIKKLKELENDSERVLEYNMVENEWILREAEIMTEIPRDALELLDYTQIFELMNVINSGDEPEGDKKKAKKEVKKQRRGGK